MYRTIDCDTWDDSWFAERSRDAKLLFLYFITNRRTSAAGCLEITNRVIEFDTGMDGDAIAGAMTDLGDRVVWWPSLNVVFVRNFFKHQRRNSNRENFRKAAAASLEDVPELVRRTVWDAYPELEETTHTQPIPNPSEGMIPYLTHPYPMGIKKQKQKQSRVSRAQRKLAQQRRRTSTRRTRRSTHGRSMNSGSTRCALTGKRKNSWTITALGARR